MATPLSKIANLPADVHADGLIVGASLPGSGRQIVDREALTGATTLFRKTADLINDLTAGHREAKILFARTERCYRSVLADTRSAVAQQARIEMDRLDTVWEKKIRSDLRIQLRARAAAGGVTDQRELARRVDAVIQQIERHFNAQSAFIRQASLLRFDDPVEYQKAMRAALSKSDPSIKPSDLEELSDLTRHLPFAKHAPDVPLPPTGQGDQLLKALRGLQASNDVVAALVELERFCGEGHWLYEDVVRLVDGRVAGVAAADAKIVDDLVNKVQGRTAEAVALGHPAFFERVWKPAQRTAEELRALLNGDLAKNFPDPKHQWRVETITEPVLATVQRGTGGELLDSGVWLIRESPDGRFAMPVFALEVKSGELLESITQQVLNRQRIAGGLVDIRGVTYQLTPPPVIEMQSALATTRAVTDKRILGLLKKGEQLGLGPADRLLSVTLTMSRSQIRRASEAMVRARLRQLHKLTE